MRFTGVGDHFGTHLSASMVTGLVTTTATAPVDVIKTHMFVGKQSPAIWEPYEVLLVRGNSPSPTASLHEC